MSMSGTRRTRNVKETREDQRGRYGRATLTRGSVQEIKAIVDEVFHPGDSDDYEWNDNIVRVTVIIEDDDQAYDDQLKGIPLVLEENPSVISQYYGSDGLPGSPCVVRFMMPNIQSTARVYLQSVRNEKPEDTTGIPNNKNYLTQKAFSITKAILG